MDFFVVFKKIKRAMKTHAPLIFNGADTRTRTADPLITNQ